ncbi:MAG: acyltransferase family protein [Muribaculaceae bacterium]|nr:acyltransferase family protein [Muribaculaceae bacterium]
MNDKANIMPGAESNKRIGWIDLAKGICIVLVVFNHVNVALQIRYPFAPQINSFRMPLYFMLSGLFFKQYEGFVGFLKRKTNKLLIPFVFFLLATSVIPYALLHHECSLVFFVQKINGPVYNFAIWFLLCLFEINILFYFIQWLVGRLIPNYQEITVVAVSLLLGACGLALGWAKVWVPFYLPSMLTALPFFAFGWWIRRHTQFLTSKFNYKRDISIIIIGLIVIILLPAPVIYSFNVVPKDLSILMVYPCGILGIMVVLIAAKMINYLPLVSFWGRYSIMILCTHQVVVLLIAELCKRYFPSPNPLLHVIVVLVATLVVCHVLIHFMKRYMPHVTAQKDVIKVP